MTVILRGDWLLVHTRVSKRAEISIMEVEVLKINTNDEYDIHDCPLPLLMKRYFCHIYLCPRGEELLIYDGGSIISMGMLGQMNGCCQREVNDDRMMLRHIDGSGRCFS